MSMHDAWSLRPWKCDEVSAVKRLWTNISIHLPLAIVRAAAPLSDDRRVNAMLHTKPVEASGFRRGYKYKWFQAMRVFTFPIYLCLRFGLLDTLDKPLQYQCFSQPIPLNGFIHNRHLTRSVKQLSVAAPGTITITVTPPTQQYQH